MTDAEIDAALEASDRLADEIEALFEGEEAADCVMALATVLGRCVARFSEDGRQEAVVERFSSFIEAAEFEMKSELLRGMN